MATAFTHALVGAAISRAAPRALQSRRVAATCAALATLPDLDVVSFALDIPYGAMLGHRGLSHSLLFSVLAAAAVVALTLALRPRRGAFGIATALHYGAVLFAAGASHGVLDAMTDAGLGVGFFIPFDDRRIFLPWRPLATSPIGVAAFVSVRGLTILGNEIVYVGLPVIAVLAAVRLLARVPGRGPADAAKGVMPPEPDD